MSDGGVRKRIQIRVEKVHYIRTDCAVAQYDRSSRDGAGPTRLMDLAGISRGGNAGARYEKANGDLIPV